MIKDFINNNKDLSLVAGMILILVVLFSPIPSVFLDMAIIINFGLGLTILLLTFYVSKPVEFSTFPSILLISTLFRLSLNVAATRLILTGGEAGEVIGSIGSFAVGGEFIVGLVVFFILVVVQYVVVTSGAQRVSEVAARFVLDAMPGQQMSIDADLNMGLIDQEEALKRRAALEKEAAFYGAMDGASKFVKGDSIAGVIILLIDIIAGWIVGVAQMGMTWNEALATFSLLTIGDGIATQLPALIISIATGIIVTRSSADADLSTEVLKQLSSFPRILLIVTVALTGLMLLPGMPKWPILILASLALFAWYQLSQINKSKSQQEQISETVSSNPTSDTPTVLSVAFGKTLTEAWKDNEALILDRVATLRDNHTKKYGLSFPAVSFQDGTGLKANEYAVYLFGSKYASGEIQPDQFLAIKSEQSNTSIGGSEIRDPAFGLPAVWIDESQRAEAENARHTIVDPITVFVTHLGEILDREVGTLLTRNTVSLMVNDVRTRQHGLIEELIPNQLSVSDIQNILQNLLSEGVSIFNLDLILEHLVDLSRAEKNTTALTEQLRQRMGQHICSRLKDRHDQLAVLSLDPRLENQLVTSAATSADPDNLPIEPKLAEQLLKQLAGHANAMLAQGRNPVLLCSAKIRRQMRLLTRRGVSKLSVISVQEIPATIELSSFAIVKTDIPAKTATPGQTGRQLQDAVS